jgi:hypothetical protein
MSSALGNIDPNRIALNRQAREAAERQRQVEEEQRRRREEEISRELEAERQKIVERQAPTPRRSDLVLDPEKGWVFAAPVSPQPVDQDREIQRQINEAISQFIKEEKAKGQVPGDVMAFYDEKTGMITVEGRRFFPTSTQPKEPAPIAPVSPPVVEDDFATLTPAAGLKGRNVFTGTSRSGQVETVIIGKQQQPGSELVTVESRKPTQDAITFTKTATIRQLPQGEPDMGYLMPVPGRPRTFEEIGPFGQIGRTTISRKEIPSSIAEAEGFIVPEPAKDDPLAGFVGPFVNIGETVRAFGASVITGKPFKPQYVPELEASSLEAVGRGQQFLTFGGRPFGSVLFTEESFKNLGKVGEEAAKSPLYFIGSGLGSAAIWIGTLGAAPLARTGLKAVSSVGRSVKSSFSMSARPIVITTQPRLLPGALVGPQQALIKENITAAQRTTKIVGEKQLVDVTGLKRPATEADISDILLGYKVEPAKEVHMTRAVESKLFDEINKVKAELKKPDLGEFREVKGSGGTVLLQKTEQVQKPVVKQKQKPIEIKTEPAAAVDLLGGKTGIERKRLKQTQQEIESIIVLRTPEQKPASKSLTAGLFDFKVTAKPAEILLPAVDIRPQVKVKQATRLASKVELLPKVSVGLGTQQRIGFQQTQARATKQAARTATRTLLGTKTLAKFNFGTRTITRQQRQRPPPPPLRLRTDIKKRKKDFIEIGGTKTKGLGVFSLPTPGLSIKGSNTSIKKKKKELKKLAKFFV